MSLFSDLSGWFSGAVNGVADLATRAWGAIRTVWHVFGQITLLVSGAWNWMVNGVGWLGDQIGGFCAAVYGAVRHILLEAIPEAAGWALKRAVGWARALAADVERWARGAVKALSSWALKEVRSIWSWITKAVGLLTRDVRKAWNWITQTGRRATELVLHPDRLAAWVLRALIVPLVKWVLTSSAPVLVWLLRGARNHGLQLAHVVEEILHDLV